MDILEVAGALLGVLYLWLEYRASVYLWPVSIVMPAVYLGVYYRAGLYADMAIQVYFILASVYGWFVWILKRKTSGYSESVESGISHFSVRQLVVILPVFIVVFLFIGWLLDSYTDSNVPWLDSFTTSFSMLAMWLLARKYVEQWLVWILVDVVSSGLYIYKELYFTAALYALYTVIACLGYRKWLQLMENDGRAD